MAPGTSPNVVPGGPDVFWASLVRAQLCVWELQGAIEGQPDGGDHDHPPQDSWHHGHGAASAVTARSASQQRRGPGSAEESGSHRHAPMGGSTSPKFMPKDGSISPKFMSMDGSIFRDNRGQGSAYESTFHVSTDGSTSPKFKPTDGSTFHEHRGQGSAYESTFHVSTDGSTSPKFKPKDGSSSPKFMSMDGSIFHEHRGQGCAYESTFHAPMGESTSPKFMSMDGSTFHEHQGRGSTYESTFHVSTDGSTSPKFASTDGSVLPKIMPVDESIFHEHQGHGSTLKSIFHMSTGGSISPTSMVDKNISPESVPTDESVFHEHQGPGSAYESIFHVSADGTICPKPVPVDGSIFHEDQGCGYTYKSISHVSTGGSISNEDRGHVPADGSISPRSMSIDGSISPMSVLTDETISQEHVPIDGIISPKTTPTDETNSSKSVPTDGSILHEHVPKDGTISLKSMSVGGTISQENMPMEGTFLPKTMPMGGTILQENMPMEGTILPKSMPTETTILLKSVPMERTISQENVSMDGTILLKTMSMGGTILPKTMPMEETILQENMLMEGTISLKSMPMGGTISQENVPMGGTISPKPMPMGGTTSPDHRDPESSKDEEEEDDEDDDGRSSREEDAEEEEDLEEEEPHFHTNPLFQSRGSAPMGAHRVPLYRPHGATLHITEGDAAGGGTGGARTPLSPPWTPPPVGCHPAGDDISSAAQRGPPRPPGLALSDPPDLPPAAGDPPSPLRPEWGGWDPPGPPDLTPRGGDHDPPSPGYPPAVTPRGGHQDLSLPSPPTPPLGGGYQTPPTPPDLPQRGGDQKPPTPPYQPMGGGFQHPPSLQLPPRPPYQPMGGGFQPPPSLQPPHRPQPRPSPPYQPMGGGFQPPPSLQPPHRPQLPPRPPYQPMGGGYQPPPSPLPPPKPLSPSYRPLGGGCQPPPSPLPPSPLSSLPPRAPPGAGVMGGSRGAPPVPGHGCAWLPLPPGASCPGRGDEAEGPPATPLPPRPATEELPPEMGEKPPPDPPAGTHGSPRGGSPVTPALANGGLRGEAQRLAARLFHLDGFKKSQVAAFLRKNNDFSGMVAREYLDFFQFGGQTLDQALRSFLQALVLTGETQERERILSHFSRRYHRCNPGAFPSPDAVHSLTCAIMLLNTDLHGQRLGRAMTSAEFVANLSGMMDGQDFPREQLKALYGSIRSEKLAWAADEEEEEEEEDAVGGGSLAPPGRKKSNPFLELPGGAGAVTYRRGWLARKVLAEADGKKTPWGRRGWKPFQAVLKGTVLYFLKPGGRTGVPRRPLPEPGASPAPPEEGGSEAEEPLGVHHALAERASKYTKRPNVFRLQTADWRIFLFQAPTPEEMFSWISRINLVAALFSSPPFPAAVGSQRRFVRPILPAAPSRSPPEEQHRSHEAWMERAAQELFEHQRNLPEKRGRARDLDEYRLKKEYLVYERRRYETYVQVLETWISAGARDLEGWEAQAGPAVAPPDPPTLTKAHSSPSLAAEPPLAPTIRVKRNISERRTVRKIVPKRNKNLL